jgi:hypothetical protein
MTSGADSAKAERYPASSLSKPLQKNRSTIENLNDQNAVHFISVVKDPNSSIPLTTRDKTTWIYQPYTPSKQPPRKSSDAEEKNCRSPTVFGTARAVSQEERSPMKGHLQKKGVTPHSLRDRI